MHLFICHTPLHILISLMVARNEAPTRESTFVVIEDTAGLHDLARRLVSGKGREKGYKLVLLPGAANSGSLWGRTLIHRANARLLRGSDAARSSTVFLFHDLRAESQSLLNLRGSSSARRRFVLLEDGIALYSPRGLLVGSATSILKRKIAFDLRWKHARELGLHPSISEIRCFYPHLLRSNLMGKPASRLPTTLPDSIGDALPWRISDLDRAFVIIALPHTSYAADGFLTELISSSLAYCEWRKAAPVFKLHPSDKGGRGVLGRFVENPNVLPQDWPLELILLTNPMACALIGSRTSALHITRAILPNVECAYFDDRSDESGQLWATFLEDVGIPPLGRDRKFSGRTSSACALK